MTRLTSTQKRERGKLGEAKLSSWLDRCVLPYLYVEQSPLTVPAELHGKIKRPDYLVGIPNIGTIAIDAKAKSIYDNHIIIDAYEHRTFANFETYFNMSVWYACFPPDEANTCHLFLNRDLAGVPQTMRGGRSTMGVPLAITRVVDLRRDFMAALVGAIALR